MIKKFIICIFNSLILTSIFISLTFVELNIFSNILKLILLLSINLIFILYLFFKLLKYKVVSRIFYAIFMVASIFLIGYILLYKTNVLAKFSSVSSLKEYILSTKENGIFTYILIQMAQVIILPVPAAIICVVGSLIYGPFLGGLYCSIGILLGSILSYILGKTFGYKLVMWIVGKENTDKYSEILRKRGSFFLSIAFLLPMFPDDILCLIAGITNMSFKNFAIVTIITRPIGVICMSYFGSGKLIPFTGWGIYAWIAILIVVTILVIVMYKYQEKIQSYILNKIFKKKQKVD